MDTEEYLARCVVDIDLNMVRAGVVTHPAQWEAGGYHEIQAPRARYRIVDREALARLLGLGDVAQLAAVHAQWVTSALGERGPRREPQWSECVAVGRREFVEQVGAELGGRARYRQIDMSGDLHVLREAGRLAASFSTRNEPSKRPESAIFQQKS